MKYATFMTKTGDEARASGLKSLQLCPVSPWVLSNNPPSMTVGMCLAKT